MTEEAAHSRVIRALPDFRAFYQREYRGILGLAYALTGDRRAAEDLAQDAFIAAFRRWNEVGRMDYPGAWLRRVVVNRSASRFRRLAAEARALIRSYNPGIESPAPSPDSVAVWIAIRRLPRRQAEIVVLTYYAGLTQSEAAHLMGCSLETVRTHLQRARSRLADWLGDVG